jgi:hypothetical protein
MYLLIIIIVFIAVIFVLKKRVDYQEENEVEVIEAKADKMPKRALVPTDVLFRLVDRDMSLGRTNSIIFYYKLEKHELGVILYNGKLVFKLDDKIYMTMNDMKNMAILQNHRMADISDKVTLTEIIYPDTNVKAILEQEPLIKDYIITSDNKFYDLNIKVSEIQ